jgi:hypothetical protein
MKSVISIYKKHKLTVDNYVRTLVKSFPRNYLDHSEVILKEHDYIQLIYGVDLEYKQATPVVCRKERDEQHIGRDKKHYFSKLDLSKDNLYISNPYIHYRTGRASISIVHFVDGIYYVFDVNLIKLLEELNLIEFNSAHDKVKRAIYLFGSTLLAAVSVVLIGYGGYIFSTLLFSAGEGEFLHDIFKSIIAITLGLAIFDLAKQIFENEVIFRTLQDSEDKQYVVLGKFLVAIIVALSIETLMVVFKIALEDYTQMLSAFYLLIGTTIMFVGLGYFYKMIREIRPKEHN